MCLLCADAETDAEALPDGRIMALAARRHLQMVLEINAAKINPDPVCPDYDYMFQTAEAGTIWPKLCSSCEANRVEDLVHAVAFARSGKRARKALAKLYRKVRKAR
jgi:hypothetical protein